MNVNWMILTEKNQIFLQTDMPEGNQRLFWAGTCLEDLMTFQEYIMTSAQSHFVDLLILRSLAKISGYLHVNKPANLS